MKRSLVLTLFLMLLTLTYVRAQDLPTEVNVIPPSPSVMAMNKFVDVPVSHYTGTPSISVPIYELKLNQLSLPIGLSYHASGLKVEEQAGWVGAGWALNAGGNINRTVRGLPDEFLPAGSVSLKGRKGYFHNHKMYDSSGNFIYTSNCDHDPTVIIEGSGDPYTTLDSLSRGLLDTESDLYSFSSPGGSGKFVFTRDGDVVRISADDVKITDHPFDGTIPAFTGLATATDYQWTIQGTDGVVYKFSNPERTTTNSICNTGISAYDESVPNVQTTWHLDEMSIGDEWIRFDYVTEDISYSLRTSSTGRFKISGLLNISDSYTDCSNSQDVKIQRLDKITTSNGYQIKFVPGDNNRLDLAGSKNLKRVEVSKDGNSIIQYNLAYEYFGSNDKLKLISVKQTDGTNELPGYEFDYDESQAFPNISSKSQDHWGFYNGQTNNNTLVPSFKTYASYVSGGADRSPSLSHAKVGTLTKLTYPTGGYTSFDYELHNYYEVNGTEEVVKTASATGGTASNPDTEAIQFTVSANTSVSLFTETTILVGGSNAIPPLQVDPEGSYVEFRKYNGTTYEKHALTAVVDGNRFVLPAGDYEIYAHSEDVGTDYLRVEFEQTASYQAIAGGLRVKQITTHDPATGKNLIKKLEYVQEGSTNSSGVLFTPYVFGGTEVTHTGGTVNSPQSCTPGQTATLLTVTSVSQVPTSVYQGSHIGYSRVIESQVDPDDMTATYPNGNTIMTFINDKGSANHNYPYVPQEDVSFKNGKMRTQLASKNDNGTLKRVTETINHYSATQGATIVSGVRYSQIKTSECFSCNANEDWAVNTYSIRSTWHRLDRTEVIAYDDDYNPNPGPSDPPNAEFSNETIYAYAPGSTPSHYMPVSQTVKDSDGKDLKTSYTRIVATPSLVSSATTTRDGVSISSQKFTYHGNSPLMISKRIIDPDAAGQSPPVLPPVIPQVKYTYGDQNTIIEARQFPAGESATYTNDAGVITSFIWGYGHAHPIAQVVNAKEVDVAFTSFEAGHQGNWSYTVDNKTGIDVVSGANYHDLTNNAITKGSLTTGTRYVVSFWAKGGTVSVSGEVSARNAIESDANGWQYYEKIVTGVTTTTISGTASIDEVRLYPLGAEMTSFVYDPGVGRISESSPNGISTHYVYDTYNRLIQILDRDRNIIKLFEYNYQQTITN